MDGYGNSPLEVMARDAMRRGLCFIEEFDYVARWVVNTATALPANGAVEVPIQIDSSSDFIIQRYNGSVYSDTTTIVANPNYLVSFTKDSSGRRMSSGPVAWNNIIGGFFGTKYPGQLACPVLLASKSTYTVKLENLTAAAPNNVELALHGFKVYYTPADAAPEERHLADRIGIFHVL